jgi:hypothetical protein
MPAVYQENTLQMEWCLSCHRAPEKFIRPLSEITNTKWDVNTLSDEERLKLKEEYRIRNTDMLTSCSTCHR